MGRFKNNLPIPVNLSYIVLPFTESLHNKMFHILLEFVRSNPCRLCFFLNFIGFFYNYACLICNIRSPGCSFGSRFADFVDCLHNTADRCQQFFRRCREIGYLSVDLSRIIAVRVRHIRKCCETVYHIRSNESQKLLRPFCQIVDSIHHILGHILNMHNSCL